MLSVKLLRLDEVFSDVLLLVLDLVKESLCHWQEVLYLQSTGVWTIVNFTTVWQQKGAWGSCGFLGQFWACQRTSWCLQLLGIYWTAGVWNFLNFIPLTGQKNRALFAIVLYVSSIDATHKVGVPIFVVLAEVERVSHWCVLVLLIQFSGLAENDALLSFRRLNVWFAQKRRFSWKCGVFAVEGSHGRPVGIDQGGVIFSQRFRVLLRLDKDQRWCRGLLFRGREVVRRVIWAKHRLIEHDKQINKIFNEFLIINLSNY